MGEKMRRKIRKEKKVRPRPGKSALMEAAFPSPAAKLPLFFKANLGRVSAERRKKSRRGLDFLKKKRSHSQHAGPKRRKQLGDPARQHLESTRTDRRATRPRPQDRPRPTPAGRPLGGAARGRCAPSGRQPVSLPCLPFAAPPPGRCRRQNQTRLGPPRPSPRLGPAAGRRAARAMVRARGSLLGPPPPQWPGCRAPRLRATRARRWPPGGLQRPATPPGRRQGRPALSGSRRLSP